MTARRDPVVTLHAADTPSLQEVQSRRRRLHGLVLVVFVAVAAGVAVLSWASDQLFRRPLEFLDVGTLRIALVVLSAGFALYVHLQERSLSRVHDALVEERILSSALSERLRELAALTQAGKAVSAVLSLEDVLEAILESARELLGATEGSIMLADRDDKNLRIAASIGIEDEVARSAVIPIGDGVAGWVAEAREPVMISGDLPEERFRGFVPKRRHVRSAMVAPLHAKGDLVGVLNVSISEGDRRYREYDLRALAVFAEQAAIAITNAGLYEREREASARLAEVDARRRDFLATITHDLKTPLTSILGYVRLLRSKGETVTQTEAQEFAEIIERQGERILEMVEQLLEAGRLEEGAPTLSRKPLDLTAIVKRQVEAVRAWAGSRPIEVVASDDVPVVFGDETAVEHILANLLDNAIKYSPESSRVTVEVEAHPDDVCISVTDQGPGIPEDQLEEVFERYRRASTRGIPGSVGLGLFIVQSLAQAHGGRAWVENVAGNGARVSFSLPLRRSRR